MDLTTIQKARIIVGLAILAWCFAYLGARAIIILA